MNEKALFRIVTEGLPPLKQPGKWSNEFKSFHKQITTVDPEARPTAAELLRVSNNNESKQQYSHKAASFYIQSSSSSCFG